MKGRNGVFEIPMSFTPHNLRSMSSPRSSLQHSNKLTHIMPMFLALSPIHNDYWEAKQC